jgi:hypothetical protein
MSARRAWGVGPVPSQPCVGETPTRCAASTDVALHESAYGECHTGATKMRFPFTVEQFLAVFREYNDATGVMPFILVGLALLLVAMTKVAEPWPDRAIAAGLAILWLWSGIVYHWMFFAPINPLARVFAGLFVLQGVILLVLGVARGGLSFRPSRTGAGLAGWLVITYALLVYPLLGLAQGHGYPDGPSFGAPCPTTIFYFGMLLWTDNGHRAPYTAIAFAWSLVGTSAAFAFGMYEDFGLLVAAAVVLVTAVRRRNAARLVISPGP